jgi:Predicted AAA-ATPase/PD-(D/E)XK nuclease superfamily
MKILPLSLQSLSEIYDNNAIYVDKTEYIHQLATTGKCYFLSRPRRFGKSLLVSTFRELFEANKILFQGLWIENKWDWSVKYPVIHISFEVLDYHENKLVESIENELNLIATQFDVTLTQKGFKPRFRELIALLHQKYQQKVVILIDEYDKPIIEYLENHTLRQAKKNQQILKRFYSVLKSADKMLKFLFITGVSKFSKVSLFSDLNQLTDLTLEPHYAGLTGYTETELIHSFEPYLTAAAQRLKLSQPQLIAKMKIWYDGYSWDGETRLYNPFGTLQFLSAQVFKNYWFASATPTFLIQEMRKYGYFEMENIRVENSFMDKYDLDNIGIVQLLFQTGYLTIRKIHPSGSYILDYPNKEVRESMYKHLMSNLAPNPRRNDTGLTIEDLQAAFEKGNLVRVQAVIASMLADLPYHTFEDSSEGLYHGLIHILFNYLGLVMQSEAHSSKGRADVVVQTLTHIYIFEFKINRSAEEAFQQILDNEYAEKYRAIGKPILAIGVNFKTQNRKMDPWKQDFL